MEYTAKPRPADVNELKAELIRNAAFVAYESKKVGALSRWLDERKDRRVLYVFDTDVMVSHCAPWRAGPADDNFLGRGYGQILPQLPYASLEANDRQVALLEERRRAEAVCWLLARKALWGALDRRIPILQTKSHFDETLSVFAKIKQNAKAEPTRNTPEDRQDQALDQTLRFISRHAAEPEWPIEENPGRFLSHVLTSMQMRDLQRSSTHVREWDGFLDLIRRSGAIFELSEFRSPEGALSPVQATAWDEMCTQLKSSRDGSSTEWQEFLSAFRQVVAPMHFQHKRPNLEVDIEALSEVALVNRKLAENDTPLRIVLVTGDRKIVLALGAARGHHLPAKGQQLADFAFDHVHHLWSLVDGIAANIASRGKTVHSELFSGFLAFEDEQKSESSNVERLVKYAIRAEPSLAHRIAKQDTDRAYKRWSEFSEGAANIHRHFLVDASNIEKISEVILEKLKLHGLELNSDRLKTLVVETMSRARDRANVEFSGIGANSILDAHRHGVRNPPDLMFDSFKVTNRIFRDLALPKRVFLNADDFSRRFELIVDDCYQPEELIDDDYRQECYLKYLVLGALFASANQWIVAEQHAESAARIVERAKALKDPIRMRSAEVGDAKSNMSGREAYYLLAVATRIRSRGARDYNESERWLSKARECLLEDRLQGTGLRVPFIRFDSEALALALARYYNARSRASHLAYDDLADGIYRSARVLLKSRMAMKEEGGDRAPGERIENLPTSTRANIAANLLQVGVIAAFRESKNFVGQESSPVDSELLAEELELLINHTSLMSAVAQANKQTLVPLADEAAEIICSPLMMLYAVVAAMIVKNSRLWTPTTEIELVNLFSSRHSSITDYDKWRFKMLLHFSKSLLTRKIS